MKKFCIIVLVLLLYVNVFCNLYMDEETESIYYANNTDTSVHIIAKTQYADTIMPCIFSENVHRTSVSPHSERDALIDFDFLNNTDTITLFIIKKDDVLNYSWKEIADNSMFLSIYILSKNDILLLSETKFNKTIPYPPTWKMRNMKIYTPKNR